MKEILDTCLTILDIANKATELYDWFTGISSGNKLKATLNDLSNKKSNVVRLSDKILYAADYQQAVNRDTLNQLKNKQQIHDMLHPLAQELDTDLLVSAVVSTPDKLRHAFRKDPWELLIDPRPVNRVKKPNNPDLVPIAFFENNVHYIGWQTRGALPSLFNCAFESNGTLLVPSTKIITPEPLLPTQQSAKDGFIEDLMDWLGFHDAKERFYLSPHIPRKIALKVSSNRFFSIQESLLAVIDCTITGSGEDYLAFGLNGIYYHNPDHAAHIGARFIPYLEFLSRTFCKEGLIEVSLDKQCFLYTANCILNRAEIIAVLDGVRKVVKKHQLVMKKGGGEMGG